ncbi:MAG: HAD family phosphatase [Methylococcales bacterium]|nr:HAD family phosphatase [Methylococcales bacterium]
MIKPSNFSAVIFDMDGLVLETETAYLIGWQQAVEAMGYPYDQGFFLSLWGLDVGLIKQMLLDYYGADFDLKQFQKSSGIYWLAHVKQHGIQKKPGVEALLDCLKKHQIPYCLATNSPEKSARDCLAMAGLEGVFDIIIGRESVQHSKPAPDVFLKAANTLHCPIEQCLVLEDSIIGLTAAQRAGAYTFFIPSQSEYKIDKSFSNYSILNTLTDVIPFINA